MRQEVNWLFFYVFVFFVFEALIVKRVKFNFLLILNILQTWKISHAAMLIVVIRVFLFA